MVAKDQLVVNAYKAPTMNLENVVDNYTPAIVPQVNDQNISNLFVEGEDSYPVQQIYRIYGSLHR